MPIGISPGRAGGMPIGSMPPRSEGAHREAQQHAMTQVDAAIGIIKTPSLLQQLQQNARSPELELHDALHRKAEIERHLAFAELEHHVETEQSLHNKALDEEKARMNAVAELEQHDSQSRIGMQWKAAEDDRSRGGMQRGPAHCYGWQQMPMGQPGQMPMGQPGQMPMGQYGQMPMGQMPMEHMPMGQPGQMPMGQPGQMPMGQMPMEHMPMGQPGQMPMGQPGQMPMGQMPMEQMPMEQMAMGQPGPMPMGQPPGMPMGHPHSNPSISPRDSAALASNLASSFVERVHRSMSPHGSHRSMSPRSASRSPKTTNTASTFDTVPQQSHSSAHQSPKDPLKMAAGTEADATSDFKLADGESFQAEDMLKAFQDNKPKVVSMDELRLELEKEAADRKGVKLDEERRHRDQSQETRDSASKQMNEAMAVKKMNDAAASRKLFDAKAMNGVQPKLSETDQERELEVRMKQLKEQQEAVQHFDSEWKQVRWMPAAA